MQGVDLSVLQRLTSYWSEGYDWGRLARRLVSVPQVRVDIDGLGIHAPGWL